MKNTGNYEGKMKIGITGATGGLGRRLVEYLSASDDMQIRILARKSSDIGVFKDLPIEIVCGDVADNTGITEFIKGLDICCHLASAVDSSDREQLLLTNVGGTANICEAIYRHENKCRLLVCSSIVVKNQTVINRYFSSEYTKSKCKAEKVVNKYRNKISITKIYPGYIFGGYDKNFIPSILTVLNSNLDFLVKGGELKAPIVHVDKLCELFFLCIKNNSSISKEYVAIPDNDFGIHDFIREVARQMGKTPPTKFYPRLPLLLYANISRIIDKISGGKIKNKISVRVINALSARAKYTYNGELPWNAVIDLPQKVQEALVSHKQKLKDECKNDKLGIITLNNDGRCKWLENRVLKKLLPEILDKYNAGQKVYIIEDWISNDNGKVGVDLDWLSKLGVPVVKDISELPLDNTVTVVNTGYDSIYHEELELRSKGIQIIDEPCPAVRKLRDILQSLNSDYQVVLLCEPNHIIIKNYSSLFPADMILVQMDNYKEKILQNQIGKPFYLIPYVTFLPQRVKEIYDYITENFADRKNDYAETKCMWVAGKVSPIEEIINMSNDALCGVKDALLIITEGTTNKSVTSLTETLAEKGLNVISIGSFKAFKTYEDQHKAEKILLVRSPIPNNAEEPILNYINSMGAIN